MAQQWGGQGGQSPGGPRVPGKHLCTWVKLLTDLQILGCELHKNAFGGHLDPLREL